MRRKALVLAAVVAVVGVPFVADAYATTMAARMLALGLLAVAVHQLSARTGQASLGHGAYFGAGAYATALADHAGVHLAPLHLAVGVAAGAAAAGVAAVGLARLRGLGYVLASLAVGLLAATLATSARTVTGGSDGITTTPPVVWPGAGTLSGIGPVYLWTAAAVITVGLLLAVHARSPFAAAAIGVGDAEQRMRAIGYPVTRVLWYAHVLSGATAGAAGVLWMHATGYIAPADLGLATAAVALAAATIAHRHGLIATIAATGVLVGARDVATSYLPPAGHGPLWLGLLLLALAYAPLAGRLRQRSAVTTR